MSEGRDALHQSPEDAFNGHDFDAFRHSKGVFGSDFMPPTAFSEFPSAGSTELDGHGYFGEYGSGEMWADEDDVAKDAAPADVSTDENEWEDEVKFNEPVS